MQPLEGRSNRRVYLPPPPALVRYSTWGTEGRCVKKTTLCTLAVKMLLLNIYLTYYQKVVLNLFIDDFLSADVKYVNLRSSNDFVKLCIFLFQYYAHLQTHSYR